MKSKKSKNIIVLNNRFNTNLPILQSLAEDAFKHNSELPDHLFTQCLHEYGREDENAVMEEMLNSTDYKFKRHHYGWKVSRIGE